MNAERQIKVVVAGSVQESAGEATGSSARRDENVGPAPARGQRSWIGDAPTGNEAGTHVVSRIGVCRPEAARRYGHTA